MGKWLKLKCCFIIVTIKHFIQQNMIEKSFSYVTIFFNVFDFVSPDASTWYFSHSLQCYCTVYDTGSAQLVSNWGDNNTKKTVWGR